MSLRRQLFWGISLIFLMTFAGLQAFSVLSTRNFLQQQLASYANDAATNLSKSLEEALAKDDAILAELQIATVFDRGYYRQIILLAPDGGKIVDKELSVGVENVPQWFIALLPLETMSGQALISSGWRQTGKVVVTMHPAFAYQFLWSSFKDTLWWMISIYALALLLTGLLLRLILKPLQQIEHAAHEIRNKKFLQISDMPKAGELRKVVQAMNSMSGRIAEILDGEMAKAEAYRQEAYTDKTTGLNNRDGFDLHFNQILSDKRFLSGYLMIAEIDGLKQFNHLHGYPAGDQLLRQLGEIGLSSLNSGQVFAGRIGGTALAFVCIDGDSAIAMDTVKLASIRFNRLVIESDQSGNLTVSTGVVEFLPGHQRSEIFARVDMAIETARQSAAQELAVLKCDDSVLADGSLAWRQLISDALLEKRWVLFAQPVVSLQKGELFHHELLVRLIDHQGHYISGDKFIPMALRHQLMEEVDQAVVSLAFALLGKLGDKKKMLAINLSSQALASKNFLKWFDSMLQAHSVSAPFLSIELSEAACAREPEHTKKLLALLRQTGARFGMDHFGLDKQSLDLLRKFPPDYLKPDAGLTGSISDNEHAREHVHSLIQLAHSMGISVIAQNIETEHAKQQLLENGLEYGQGYYCGLPAEAAEILG